MECGVLRRNHARALMQDERPARLGPRDLPFVLELLEDGREGRLAHLDGVPERQGGLGPGDDTESLEDDCVERLGLFRGAVDHDEVGRGCSLQSDEEGRRRGRRAMLDGEQPIISLARDVDCRV